MNDPIRMILKSNLSTTINLSCIMIELSKRSASASVLLHCTPPPPILLFSLPLDVLDSLNGRPLARWPCQSETSNSSYGFKFVSAPHSSYPPSTDYTPYGVLFPPSWSGRYSPWALRPFVRPSLYLSFNPSFFI